MLLNFQALGNFAYAYDVKDAATGSINSRPGGGNTGGSASSPAVGRYQAINAPYPYAGRSILAPIIGLGVGIGRGLAFGLKRGADFLGERLTNVLI